MRLTLRCVLIPAIGQSRRSVTSVYKELGFRGLWLGTGARCVFTGTRHSLRLPSNCRSSHAPSGLLSAAMFLIYDGTKVLFRLPTTSGLRKSKEKK